MNPKHSIIKGLHCTLLCINKIVITWMNIHNISLLVILAYSVHSIINNFEHYIYCKKSLANWLEIDQSV